MELNKNKVLKYIIDRKFLNFGLFFFTYRFDIIFIVGALLTYSSFYFYKNTGYFPNNYIIINFFIAFIVFNFIYTLNFISDKKEDIINKPFRIKILKLLKLRKIKFYLYILFILIIIFSLFLHFKYALKILLLTLLGILYSVKPFRLKKSVLGFLSIFFTSFVLVNFYKPIEDFSFVLNFLFFSILLSILKDYGDEKGDKYSNNFNWFLIFNEKKIRIFLILMFLFLSFFNLYFNRYFLFLAAISIIFFLSFRMFFLFFSKYGLYLVSLFLFFLSYNLYQM